MPKKGQPDSYWERLMKQYAIGEYRFTTGKTPKSKKWKEVMKAIEKCPKHNQPNTNADMFGRPIACKCGYHKELSASASSLTTVTVPVTTAQPQTDKLNCGVCHMLVSVNNFNQHLLDCHAETSCDQCGKTVRGELALVSHIEKEHGRQRVELEQETQQRVDPHIGQQEQETQQRVDPHIGQQEQETQQRVDPQIGQQEQETQQRVDPQIGQQEQETQQHVDPQIGQQEQETQQRVDPQIGQQEQETQQHVDPHIGQQEQETQQRVDPQIGQQEQETQQRVDPQIGQHEQETQQPETSEQWVPAPHGHREWATFLPAPVRKNLNPGDVEWISQCLYDSAGHLKESLPCQNWYLPPTPNPTMVSPPNPVNYFRQRMFLWAPMRMWHIPLRCPTCSQQLHHSGIYNRSREVVDVDSRYYLIGGDYPRCSKCKVPFCPWSPEILDQLDPYHRNLFPAVLTKYQALDKRVVTLMKPRTQGNSSSYIQQSIHELHSEEWGRRCIHYMTDCEVHKRGAIITGGLTVYPLPPQFRPLPLAQWFETAHTHEILSHAEEMKGVITSAYGKVLKLDSTKKVTKKLAGDVGETASWMTNIANEHGQVLNSVLTTGEGPALFGVCQGIVKRYTNAGEPPPTIIYVDRDCCSQSGETPVHQWFHPWKCHVRLDVFHFMRRFTKGLTTDHHPLYGTFCSKLSSCIFVWDREDYTLLRQAKRAELKKQYRGMAPKEQQITAAITTAECARHCRRRIRPVAEIKENIDKLLQALWDRTDTAGLRLINGDYMTRVWSVQQKHMKCLQDPPEIPLYTQTGTLEKGGKLLPVYKCARGSSSLESFHRHQCSFVPGWRANAVHMQMYMVEGGSRWNLNRERETVDIANTSRTRMYDIRLMSAINTMSQRVLGTDLLPEFKPPGKPTNELIAVEYLLSQSGKGDLRPQLQGADQDVPVLPDINPEEARDAPELLDQTVCSAEDIDMQDAPSSSTTQEGQTLETSPCERCGIQLGTGDMVVHMVKHMTEDSPCEQPLAQFDSDDKQFDANIEVQSTDTTFEGDLDKPTADTSLESVPDEPVQESRCDAKGYAGWEAVDALAEYLLKLDTLATALSTTQEDRIIQLYESLHVCDKAPTPFNLKTKKEFLLGPWRASRKRGGPTPGVQATERLYMTHNQAAQSPSRNRISECVCLRLLRQYEQARNRPKDIGGKRLPIPQAIVQTYSLIQQLISDSCRIQEETNLVLVTVNITTVSVWLNKRDKRTGLNPLLKGAALIDTVSTSEVPLPEAQVRPSQHTEHGHQTIAFTEPDNQQGQCPKRPRKRASSQASTTVSTTVSTTPANTVTDTTTTLSAGMPRMPGVCPPFPQAISGWYGWPPYFMPPCPPANMPQVMPPFLPPSVPYMTQQQQSTSQSTTVSASGTVQSPRQRDWRKRKAEQEDMDRIARGEAPKKRHRAPGQYRYICTKCQQQKCAETGHTQVRGRWYCPSMGISVEEWKRQLN